MFKICLIWSLIVALANAAGVAKLTALNIQGAPTLSGLSSGGYMAVQMHIAYSASFNGSAIFAAGPYFCAKGSITFAEEECMYYMMGGPDLDTIKTYTTQQVAAKTIDNTDNLKDDKIFIYSGSKDSVVNPKVVHKLQTYYEYYVPTANIKTNYELASQHCIPTLNYGEQCDKLKSPYIGDCSYDGAGAALKQLWGDSLTKGTAIAANLQAFDQTEFYTGDGKSICLDSTGYIYIPTACAAGGSTPCKLHVSFHGCSQDQGSIGNDWANHAGFNDWAEKNNIVVVYPYAVPNQQLGNPNACWDWWGYLDASIQETTYTLQSGTQMKFAKDIVDRLTGASVKK